MRRSWLTIVLGPAVLLVLIVLPFLIYRGDVPDPMAIHWGPTGEPDGSMQPIFAVVLLGGIFVAMVFAVHRALRPAPEEAPSFLAGLFGVGGLLAAVSWLAFLANRDQASWEQATEVGLLQILGAVVVGLVVGFIGWLLAGGRSASRPRPVGVAPTLEVADPENAVWSGRGVGKLTVAVGLVVIVIALIAWGWTAVLLGLVGLCRGSCHGWAAWCSGQHGLVGLSVMDRPPRIHRARRSRDGQSDVIRRLGLPASARRSCRSGARRGIVAAGA